MKRRRRSWPRRQLTRARGLCFGLLLSKTCPSGIFQKPFRCVVLQACGVFGVLIRSSRE